MLGFETVLWGVIVESFPGALVEFTHHVGDVGAAMEGEVGALRKVLSGQWTGPRKLDLVMEL
jgi:hypothetical protein